MSSSSTTTDPIDVTAELLARHDRPGPRYTSYPTAVEFHEGFGPTEAGAALERAAAQPEAPLSLYVHLPFCRTMCTFCGCSVILREREETFDPYLERVRTEIARVAERLGERRRAVQLHWGGGTPNFLTDRQMHELMDALTGAFQVEGDAEVALEIDPRHVEGDQIARLAALGFNRISMGVQDFAPEVQEAVNRFQPHAMTERVIAECRAAGFSSVNVDLIYGLPHQTEESFQRTLDQVVELAPDRVAAFSFAYVPWLKAHQKKIAVDTLPAAERKFALLARTIRTFEDAGYRQVGMDHFARPEDELCRAIDRRALGRNFQGYTVKDAGDLIAFGMTAISDVQGAYFQNRKVLKQYLAAVDAGGLATERGVRLTPEDELRRVVINGIMCNFALSMPDVEARFGLDFGEHFAPELERLATLADEGFVTVGDGLIELTALGRRFVRNVAMVFDPYLARKTSEPRFSRTV